MTKARGAVFDVILSASEPLSAGMVVRVLGERCNQATVYRALNYLEAQGLAESFVLYCAEHGVERYFVRADSHRHWFHCESCHAFIDLGPCAMSTLVSKAEKKLAITVRRHAMYMSGLCTGCGKKQSRIAT